MKVVVSGSIAYDYLMSFPGKIREQFIEGALDNVSLSFLVESMVKQRGGTGPNIAYTLALLGGSPTLMATAGQDFSEFADWLSEHDVDLSATVTLEDEYCASFFCTTDTEQNQIASFYPGSMGRSIEVTLTEYAADAKLVIVSPNAPNTMLAVPQECRDLGIDFIFDPSQQTVRFDGDQLLQGIEGSRLLTTNVYEQSLILDKTGLTEIDILTKTGGWLVTRGGEGSTLIVDGKLHEIPAVPPTEIVEPTGAGDAFRAGLMRGMQLGLPWGVCGRMGAMAATYVLENFGPMNHHFTPAEFVARYRTHFDDEGALDALLSAAPTASSR